ncbi:unnamed protein product [Cylindrotheca closterium]|uniref:Cation/H+ exchanger transmembrane domain-containing protein n=1 Tax=Cylindrotheca closterium TaxID=2856 RepID=A0AAD2CSP7_9STRA|nr:unnamed protein product [Cylindrotheca closterium]
MSATNADIDDVFTGVPASYDEIFNSFLFLGILYLMGDVICQRGLKIVPSLVGYIATGVALGPEGWDWIPMNPASWVTLGNIGLILLIAQAGLEMDLEVLKKIGVRGFIIAVVGSILPISIGMLLSWAVLNQTGSTVIAMGCCFGPTSAGIAINVLSQCSVLESPLGQLIVAAAIVDDILALLVLSQLRALTSESGEVLVADIVIPIVSAFAWLFAGGGIALFVMPKVVDRVCKWALATLPKPLLGIMGLDSETKDGPDSNKSQTIRLCLLLLFALLVCLVPATHHSQASYLLGAFLAGLSFCQMEGLAGVFQAECQLLIDWLMRLFFAATIGFQVPLSLFSDSKVVVNGVLLFVSLLGKIAVGPLLTPVLRSGSETETEIETEIENKKRWTGEHVRNCAIVGFSMAGEAEFAFVVAVFGVSEGLIPPDLYASIVFAILLSTIFSPLLLRTVLAVAPYEAEETETLEAEESIQDKDSTAVAEVMEA